VIEVGLRVTKLRDADGQIWYVRNGSIARVGNLSQGWGPIPHKSATRTAIAATRTRTRSDELSTMMTSIVDHGVPICPTLSSKLFRLCEAEQC
jgi:small conductance mechanosensitive channel